MHFVSHRQGNTEDHATQEGEMNDPGSQETSGSQGFGANLSSVVTAKIFNIRPSPSCMTFITILVLYIRKQLLSPCFHPSPPITCLYFPFVIVFLFSFSIYDFYLFSYFSPRSSANIILLSHAFVLFFNLVFVTYLQHFFSHFNLCFWNYM